jgi:hypothetical protein
MVETTDPSVAKLPDLQASEGKRAIKSEQTVVYGLVAK